MNRRDLFWKLAYLGVAGALFLVDQVTKAWAIRRLRLGDIVEVIPGFLNFAYAQNTGIAFSMLDDHGDQGRWALSAVAMVAGLLVLYFFWRTPRSDDRILGALTLLLAGIAGNVTDRLRLGFVVDFIDVQFGNWHYPTFNVADMAIVAGAGLRVLDLFLSKKSASRNQNSSLATGSTMEIQGNAAKSFEDVHVWQRSHQFVLDAYLLSDKFPKHEIYCLTSQLRRAAISIPANFAEGFRKTSRADKLRFYGISLSSLEECRYYLRLSKDLGYGDTDALRADLEVISRMLTSYMGKIRSDIR